MTRIRGALLLAVIMAAVGVTAWSAFSGDVTYAFGGLETAGRGGVSVWNVFLARPLFYRLPIAALDALRAVITPDPRDFAAQLSIRLVTDALILAVAFVLFRGLKRFVGTPTALATALGAALALAVAPPWHYLQPDWLATVLAALAVGAACTTRRPWLGGLLGGVAGCLVVAVKLATAPTALLALLLIALLDRRRAAWAAGWTVALAAIWYVATRHFLPWEWTWLHDQSAIVRSSPIHNGITGRNVHALVKAVGNVIVLSPIVAVGPAAAAILVRHRPAGRPRWIMGAVAVVAAGLSVASGYGQGEFYMYHFAPVPVLAAAVCALAFARHPGARVPLAVAMAGFTTVSLVLLSRPDHWRIVHSGPVLHAYEAGTVLLAFIALLARRRPARRPGRWLVPGLVAFCGALVVASLPGMPFAFSAFDNAVYNGPVHPDRYAAIRRRLGPDTPVMYLTFGSVNYGLGNPTTCRYPSPQWVQRGSQDTQVLAYRSYTDNLRCLRDERSARYLVMQNNWFKPYDETPAVRALLASRFDCSPGAGVTYRSLGLTICPVRAPGPIRAGHKPPIDP